MTAATESNPTESTATESTPADAESVGAGGGMECWCCGQDYSAEQPVHLGSHPEVAVCLRCAHFLHHQARQREDALRPSIASRLRDGLRWGRRLVMERGWHQRAVIGPPLRWLGQRLP